MFDIEEEFIIKDGEDTQNCIRCKKDKSLKNFHIKTILQNDRGILDKVCNKCNTEYEIKRNERYTNITLPSDNYICPVCKRNEHEIKNHTIVIERFTHKRVFKKNKKVWVLDHDHDTGKLRGWLCNPCNVKIGGFGDSISNLKNAIKYLEGDFNECNGL